MINVLIVDDSKLVAHAMQNILEELQIHVVGIAHDGIQGLERFGECSPDVTLLDVTMPNMDGVECLAKIRELNSEAKVVMLSAVQDKDTISKCISIGAVGFLQKPIRRGNQEDLERLSQILVQATGKAI
jgi:two-component system, chemotaxis family, chemotaxis protein CheY